MYANYNWCRPFNNNSARFGRSVILPPMPSRALSFFLWSNFHGCKCSFEANVLNDCTAIEIQIGQINSIPRLSLARSSSLRLSLSLSLARSDSRPIRNLSAVSKNYRYKSVGLSFSVHSRWQNIAQHLSAAADQLYFRNFALISGERERVLIVYLLHFALLVQLNVVLFLETSNFLTFSLRCIVMKPPRS